MERNLRIVSGLILYLFVVGHLLNLALGVISAGLIDEARPIFMYLWTSRIGSLVLMTSFLVHMVLGFRTLYLRNTLNLPPYDLAQFASGFLIPPLLFPHVWGIVSMEDILHITPTYPRLMQLFWIDSPLEGLRQVLVVVVVWIHGSIGIFTWLNLKPWWSRVAPMVYPLIVMVPVLALLGFVEGGNQAIRDYEAAINSEASQPQAGNDGYSAEPANPYGQAAPAESAQPTAATYEFIYKVKWWSILAYLAALAGVLVARAIRLSGKSGNVEITYEDGTRISAPVGHTFLELSHLNHVPHANLCRGRGRCGTCRVRILAASAPLPEPNSVEQTALKITRSGPDVRLACQCVPGAGTIEIERLFEAGLSHRELHDGHPETKEAPSGQTIGEGV